MKVVGLLFSLLVLASCSLNAEQERTLNQSLSNFLSAQNELQALGMIAYVHPDVIQHYKSLGDTVFQKRFNLLDSAGFATLWTDPILQQVKKKGSKIHVRYQLKALPEEASTAIPKKISIFACSDDDGKHWFFVEEKDYFNPLIFSREKQLISEDD